MTLSMRRGFVVIGATLVLLSSSLITANAQSNPTANGYKISPVRSDLTIVKGKSSTIKVTINNPSKSPTTAKAVFNNFIASDDESGVPRLILDDKTPAPKNDFTKLVGEVENVTLDPGQSKEVTVKITVPADANSGGYYGAVRFVPVDVDQQSTVGLTASVGTLVLVTVPGNLIEKLSMKQLSAGQGGNPKSFITKGDIQIVTRLSNEGDIHAQPFGRIDVKNMFGKKVATLELNNTDPRANILPGSTRKFVDDVKAKKLLGRYTITANLASSQGSGNLVTAKASFWYMPVWAIAVLVALLLLIGGAIYLLVRKIGGSRTHRAKK